jgi:hypothetical protein
MRRIHHRIARVFGGLVCLIALTSAAAYANGTIGLQSVYIFANFTDSTGSDVTSRILSIALNNPDPPLYLDSGAVFVPTSAITGSVIDSNGTMRNDVIVSFGVLQVMGNGTTVSSPIAIVSLERDSTVPLGADFTIELTVDPDLSGVPDIASLGYLPLLTFSTDTESTNDVDQTFVDRINAGSFAVFEKEDKEGPVEGFSLSNIDRAAVVIDVPFASYRGTPSGESHVTDLSAYGSDDPLKIITGNTLARTIGGVIAPLSTLNSVTGSAVNPKPSLYGGDRININSHLKLTALSARRTSSGMCQVGHIFRVIAQFQNTDESKVFSLPTAKVAKLTKGNTLIDSVIQESDLFGVFPPGFKFTVRFDIRLASCDSFEFRVDILAYFVAEI